MDRDAVFVYAFDGVVEEDASLHTMKVSTIWKDTVKDVCQYFGYGTPADLYAAQEELQAKILERVMSKPFLS